MANSTPSNPGFKAGGTANNNDLLLDIWGGEIQASYQRMTIMRELVRVFSLTNGKTLRFPRVGRATATYHTPGVEIVGKQIDHDEITLSSDDKLISDVFLSDIQEILNHFDVRAEYTRQLSEALAVDYDKNVMRALIKSARTDDLLGGPVAAPVQVTGMDTDAVKLFDAVSKAKETLDNNFVRIDQVPVHALFKNAQWYLMARSDKNLNRDYNGGDASIRNHTLTTIDGVVIHKTNIAPYGVTDVGNATIPTRYRINMIPTVGAVWTPDAVATAEVQGVGVQVVDQPEKQGTLILARQMSGSDVFRASNAVELRTATPA